MTKGWARRGDEGRMESDGLPEAARSLNFNTVKHREAEMKRGAAETEM